MDFNVSIRDENQDIKILAPWLLNCLNRLSGSNPTKFILKQQVFAQTPMNGFKAEIREEQQEQQEQQEQRVHKVLIK